MGSSSLRPVFREDDAAQGEGRAGPLVFLDAPVVVGAEVDDAVLFVDGIGFQVEAGRVDVGADDLDAGGHRFFADDGEDDGFPFLIPVDFVPRFQFGHFIEGAESPRFGLSDDLCHGEALGARGVEKCFISFAVVQRLLSFFGACPLPYRSGSAVAFHW